MLAVAALRALLLDGLPVHGRPARDGHRAVPWLIGATAATAVERHERVRRDRGLAHGARPTRRSPAGAGVRFRVTAQPLVDARPAVEVAAEGDHRLHGEVQADVAVEAVTACRRWHVPADSLRRIITAHRRPVTDTSRANLIHFALAPSTAFTRLSLACLLSSCRLLAALQNELEGQIITNDQRK